MSVPFPLVSIAIPTYNRANEFLKQAIHAALEQTYPNIEIIVSNNHSTDNTEEIVKSFADPRVRYFRQPTNIGYMKNYDFCLEQARGAYFSLLPDDDLMDKDFIDVCMKAANYKTDVGIIRAGTRVIGHEGDVRAVYPNGAAGLPTLEFFLAWFSGKTGPYLCSTLFNTERLREIGGIQHKYNMLHDVSTIFKLTAQFGRVDVEEVKASFRKHYGDVTFNETVARWCDDSIMLLDLMCDLVPEKKDLIRDKGTRFLAYLCYNRASAVRSSVWRLYAFFTVFFKFRFQHLPARHQLKHKIR